VEQPVMDLVPSLRKDANLKVEVVETTGLIGVLRFNQLFPPFDNAAIRRAALKAVNQTDFMAAVAGEADPGLNNAHVGFFAPSSPYASDAGMEMLSGKFKLDALRREVEQAGYKGEKVVFLGATDVARISAICQVGADMLSKIGLNVDYVATDWGTVVQRMNRKQPIADGGWSIFGAMWGGYDWYSPAGDVSLRGNGMNAWFGWPDAPKLEALRDQWRAGPGDAEGAGSGYPVAGVPGCAVHAARAVLSAGGVSERFGGHDEGADTVHGRAAGVGRRIARFRVMLAKGVTALLYRDRAVVASPFRMIDPSASPPSMQNSKLTHQN
jgi:Bacterial extracellular solute-binding proteins, family 5 Middle